MQCSKLLKYTPVMTKRFQVYGWVRPTFKPNESDGKTYDLGQFDSLEEAVAVRKERRAVGWGRIEIQEFAPRLEQGQP